MNQTNLLKEAYDYGYKLALAEAGLLDKEAIFKEVWDAAKRSSGKFFNLFGRGEEGVTTVRKASTPLVARVAPQKSVPITQATAQSLAPKSKNFKTWQANKKAIPDATRFGQRVGGQLVFNV